MNNNQLIDEGYAHLHAAVKKLFDGDGLGELLSIIVYLYRIHYNTERNKESEFHQRVTEVTLLLMVHLGKLYEEYEQVNHFVAKTKAEEGRNV